MVPNGLAIVLNFDDKFRIFCLISSINQNISQDKERCPKPSFS